MDQHTTDANRTPLISVGLARPIQLVLDAFGVDVYVAPPLIYLVTPDTAAAALANGGLVDIHGWGFDPGSQVLFTLGHYRRVHWPPDSPSIAWWPRPWNDAGMRLFSGCASSSTGWRLFASRPRDITCPDWTSLLGLAAALPRVWASAGAEIQTKKRIVRLLVEEDIAKEVADPPARIVLVVHWKGGQHTQLDVARQRIRQREAARKRRKKVLEGTPAASAVEKLFLEPCGRCGSA
jgi:hypothetical protein